MKYSKLINKNKNILYFFLVILIIQLLITKLFTNTKKFSKQAYLNRKAKLKAQENNNIIL